MRFWDSSAIVPLLADEPATPGMTNTLEADPAMLVWWTAPVECASAIARREREGRLRAVDSAEAFARLSDLQLAWREIEPLDQVRRTAIRLLRTHLLSAGDALHLAAALVVAEDHPGSLPFVTLDSHLALAAEREGFPIVGA